jgi:hypothetical protein
MPADISAAPASERGYYQHPAAQHPAAQHPGAQNPGAQGPSASGGFSEPPPAYPVRRETCWLCGQTNMTYQLVPDGGDACADVRWYCRDARECTERWAVAKTRSSRP